MVQSTKMAFPQFNFFFISKCAFDSFCLFKYDFLMFIRVKWCFIRVTDLINITTKNGKGVEKFVLQWKTFYFCKCSQFDKIYAPIICEIKTKKRKHRMYLSLSFHILNQTSFGINVWHFQMRIVSSWNYQWMVMYFYIHNKKNYERLLNIMFECK